MKTPFRLLFVLLITMQTVLGQNVKVFSKSFKTDKNTTAYIEIPDGSVKFVSSPDDSIHINYDINFMKLPKKEHQRILDSVRIEATQENNLISIKKHPNVKQSLNASSYVSIFSLDRLIYETKDTTAISRKLKEDISNEITEIKSYKSYHEARAKIIYANDLKRKERLLKKAVKWQNNRNFKRNFIIKIPKDISLKIVAKGSLLNFHDEFDNQISIRLDYGRLYINRIENPKNELKIHNSLVIAHNISGGKLETDRVFKALITELNNVDIESEFSKIEIGELGSNNKITDFNSEYFFYNWTKDFQRFDLFSDYSKIHFFYPNLNHGLEVIGYNTRNVMGNDSFEVTMQPKSKERNQLMSKPLNPKEKSSGLIFFDIINGIIYSYNDSIKK
ncbi:hypothetical protein [Winogradskyella sediminis]|uniref:hypothetical protein n=1 Tax=Winogradskyella sediminis TaxID=1382466 RepID=UPI000E37E40A|nr:hypothetical protein [Winogradskyella sediminis]REG87621.1 hypothetical protein C8N41_102466 [Winogradskyella sediminis]